MGFSYLEGKRWSQVTRDERFFCQRLYELVKAEPVENFVRYLSDKLDLDLPAGGEWEIGFEVCFYRDLWQHRGCPGRPFSLKRTFALCLFGESAIVIIEAKAAGGFESNQNESFKRDIAEVQRLTGLGNVCLVGLCSSKYILDEDSSSTFGGKVVRWADLARRYSNDEVLNRADDVHEKAKAFANYGRNSDANLSGAVLFEAFQGGADWWVGRGGGISGKRFLEDVRTGRWRDQIYEVNTKADEPPSPNYFSLARFAQAVGDGGVGENVVK